MVGLGWVGVALSRLCLVTRCLCPPRQAPTSRGASGVPAVPPGLERCQRPRPPPETGNGGHHARGVAPGSRLFASAPPCARCGRAGLGEAGPAAIRRVLGGDASPCPACSPRSLSLWVGGVEQRLWLCMQRQSNLLSFSERWYIYISGGHRYIYIIYLYIEKYIYIYLFYLEPFHLTWHTRANVHGNASPSRPPRPRFAPRAA